MREQLISEIACSSIIEAGVLASASVGKATPQSKAPTTDSVADLVKVHALRMLAVIYPSVHSV